MMSLYDIHKNNYRKGLVQFVGNFMYKKVDQFFIFIRTKGSKRIIAGLSP